MSDSLQVDFRTEDLSGLAPQRFTVCDRRHTLIVHLDGRMRSLSTTVSGYVWNAPALVGQSWFIPAGVDYESRIEAERFSYAVLKLSPVVKGDFTPWQAVSDPFIYHCVVELSKLTAEDGRLRDALLQSLSLYLTRLGSRPFREVAVLELIRNFVDSHLEKPLTLEQISGVLGESKHAIKRCLREALQTTPAQYVLERRVERARWLLTHTSLNLAQVALEVGFATQSHLTATFKQRTGLTPGEWRRTTGRRVSPIPFCQRTKHE